MQYKIRIYKKTLDQVYSKAGFLAVLLEIYIYFSFIWLIFLKIVHLHAVFYYVFLGGITGCVLLCTKRVNIGVTSFFLIFLILIIINVSVVAYPYYAFIESMEAFTGIIVPIVIISSREFNVVVFLNKWLEFAKKNIFLVFVSIIIFKLNWVNYSIFAGICVPNVFILCFGLLMQEKQQNKNLTVLILINILAVVLWGGRMAAVTTLCMYTIAYLFSKRNRKWKKIMFIFCLGISIVCIYLNLSFLLTRVNSILSSWGIGSRSVQLLLNQLRGGKMYMTSRDIIYSKCIDFIKMHKGAPGGFGVVLYLTDGEFYFAHNIILQLLVQFGALGTIFLLFILVFRINEMGRRLTLLERKFLFFLFFSFGMLSMTGASIWTHYMSTVGLAMLFFYKPNHIET